jgi:hypothetical protein
LKNLLDNQERLESGGLDVMNLAPFFTGVDCFDVKQEGTEKRLQ